MKKGDKASTHFNCDQDLRKSRLKLLNGKESAAMAPSGICAELNTLHTYSAIHHRFPKFLHHLFCKLKLLPHSYN